MNTELLERDWGDYVYGAVTFREADSDSGIFDYTVHVSRSPSGLGGRSTSEKETRTCLKPMKIKCIA